MFPAHARGTSFNMRSYWLCLMALFCVWGCPAYSAFPTSHNNNAAKDKAQAARQAQRQYQGRVLKVETLQASYRVKILQKSGRVVSVEIKRAVYVTSPGSHSHSSSRSKAKKSGNRE